MDIRRCLKEVSAETEQRMQIVEDALKKCPPGRMREDRHSNNYYLILDYYEKGKRRTHSLTKDNEMLDCLIRKELHQKELQSLKSVQKVMDYAQRNLIDFELNKAIAEMMAKYPHLPEERILAALGSQNLYSSQSAQTQAAEWAADYERSTYKPEELKQITSRGLKVRSKSEVLIAEKLYQYDLPFRYEEVLHFSNFTLNPDFIIRRSDGKLFYWEHQGLTNDKTYIERQFKKNQLYYSVGIVPWENYIVTYDSTSGVDLRRVEFEIQNRLLG